MYPIPRIVKLLLAFLMAFFLLHLPAIPTSQPEVQITITIVPGP